MKPLKAVWKSAQEHLSCSCYVTQNRSVVECVNHPDALSRRNDLWVHAEDGVLRVYHVVPGGSHGGYCFLPLEDLTAAKEAEQVVLAAKPAVAAQLQAVRAAYAAWAASDED